MIEAHSLPLWKLNLVGENTSKENVLPKEMSFQVEFEALIQEDGGGVCEFLSHTMEMTTNSTQVSQALAWSQTAFFSLESFSPGVVWQCYQYF